MAVIVVGDFHAGDAWALLEEQFGSLEASGDAPPRLPPVDPRTGRVEMPGLQGSARAAWALPKLSPEEEPAVRVALTAVAAAAANREHGWLLPRMGFQVYREGGVAEVMGSCIAKPRVGESCEEVFRRALMKLREDGISAGSLRWFRQRAWIDRLRELEDPTTRAEAIARAWSRGLDLDTQWALIDRMRFLTLEQVDAALRTHLTPENLGMAVGELDQAFDTHSVRLPKGPPAGDRTSALFDLVTTVPREPLPAMWPEPVEDYGISSDGRVVVAFNPANTLFEMRLVYPWGWRDDALLPNALAAWEAGRRFPGSVHQQLMPYGVRVKVQSVSAHRTVLRVDGPREGIDPALQLLPRALSGAVVDRERTFARINDAQDAWALYGSAGLPQRTASVDTATLAVALEPLSRLQPVVLYSGTEDPEMLARSTPGEAREQALPAVLDHRGSRVGVRPGERPMVPVVLHVRLPDRPVEDAPLFELVARFYSGRTGMVREQLREERALTYSYQSEVHRGGAEGDWMVMRAYTRAERAQEAAEVLFSLIDEPPLDARAWRKLLRSAERRTWSHHTGFRELPAVVHAGLEQGLEGPAQEPVWRGLEAIDQADFEALLAELATTPRALLVENAELDRAYWRQRADVEVLRD